MKSDKEPLISIIVPVFNVERYLPKCVESILVQTYKNIEVILVDDGSLDNCPDICDAYAQKDSRVIVIHKKNGGQASARNAGLDIANGEYIGFVDSDDWVLPDMYESLYKAIEKNKAQMSICGIYCGREEKNINELNKKFAFLDKEKVMECTELFKAYYGDKIIFTGVWNKLYHRNLWDDIRFPICFREDEAILYKVMDRTEKAVHIGKAKYFYFIRDGSTERKGFEPKYMITARSIDLQYEYIKDKYPEIESVIWDKRILERVTLLRDIFLSKNRKMYQEYVDELIEFLTRNYANDDSLKNQVAFIVNHTNIYSYKIRIMDFIIRLGRYVKKYLRVN